MSTDIHTLTGAYVLDAVSDVERRAFEHHMTGCPSCAQEVRELRETTVRLGSATVSVPPPRMRDWVCDSTRVTRQLSPSPRRQRRPRPRIAIAAASVVVAVGAGIGVTFTAQSGDLERQLATSHSELDRFTAVLAAPDAQLARRSGPDGRAATMVISRSANGMILLTHGLPALPPGRSVQAWFITRDGQETSAGLLDASSGTLLVPDLSAASDASSLALTVEPHEGSTSPSDDVVLAVPMTI
jgi:anti-sigma-K factor RskA